MTGKAAKKASSFLDKKSFYALSIFCIGALHFMLAQQTIKPTGRELKLALVRNEFLDKPPNKIVVVGEMNSGDKVCIS